jgi:cytochrome bd ubiquinol oxidase subunit I
MDALTLSRIQFGSTIVYHFFFVPLTLGLVVLVAIMETLYVRSGNPTYKRMTKFWSKLFLINFAMGVVTGIVQEFQFGMNWSTYSRFIGDVFGAPLAVEGLLAFFMESTFLGIWLFSWEQLNKKLHLALIWLVALGSYLSAFWILVANSFMQQPLGYAMHNGRAEMTDFFALITNPHLWVQFPHVAAGGLITGAFFVVGISAYHFLKKTKERDFFRRSMFIGLCVAFVGSIVVAGSGHLQGQEIVQSQPMKMAAMEALWDTESPASLSLFTIGNQDTRSDVVAIKVPSILSFLAYDSFTTPVTGINQLQAKYAKLYGPGDYVPPVVITYWGFRFMVGAGMLMALLATLGLFLLIKRQLLNRRWLLWTFVGAIALPYIANTAGWIFTEMGRQPWLVFGVLKTADGISPNVTPAMVLTSLIIFITLYGILAVVDVFLLSKFARKGVEEEKPVETEFVPTLAQEKTYIV